MDKPRQEICDVIFTLECLRRLGFHGDEMTPAVLNIMGIGRCYCVKLNTQAKEFITVVARQVVGLPDEEYAVEFEKAVEVWNASKGAELNTWGFYESNVVNERDVGLVSALLAKGFYLPCSMQS